MKVKELIDSLEQTRKQYGDDHEIVLQTGDLGKLPDGITYCEYPAFFIVEENIEDTKEMHTVLRAWPY